MMTTGDKKWQILGEDCPENRLVLEIGLAGGDRAKVGTASIYVEATGKKDGEHGPIPAFTEADYRLARRIASFLNGDESIPGEDARKS